MAAYDHGSGAITFEVFYFFSDLICLFKGKILYMNLHIGFEMIDRGIPRHDYQIADGNGTIIGKVTSGTQSPTLNKAIGMGYVNKEFAKADTEIFVVIRDKAIKAKVCKIPFLKK